MVDRVLRLTSTLSLLAGACAILTIICACLVSAIVVIRQHQSAEHRLNRKYKLTSDYFVMSYPWDVDPRVQEATRPVHYDIYLHPNLIAGTFDGVVNITTEVTRPVTYIAVHAKDLNITNSTLIRESGEEVAIKAAAYYPKNLFWVVEPSEVLSEGTYNLTFRYQGNLTGKIVGFYRSTYLSDDKALRYIATSKFEPVDARQAFPCFDEPALKATFAVSLVTPKDGGYMALSNMDQQSETPGPGEDKKTVKFKTSVKMSTYLACFIVGDFKAKEPEVVAGLPVTVYSTPGQVENTEFARVAARTVLQYYNDYFGIRYPLPKLDLIAIPDFVSGAMEHWGLITFRETALLFQEGVNSAANQKRVALVVAHEIAHQWFGNLVTMRWWDDLWLNEGFASFMEYKAAETISPDWKLREQGVYDDIQSVLVSDSRLTSHPIVQQVDHPDQINQLFDSISYDKGQAVLRMLEDFMEPAKFQEGIRNYLYAYMFENAATRDLWENLRKVSTVDVPAIMDTWTRQTGYPVLHVSEQGSTLVVNQTRFLLDSETADQPADSDYGYKWDIPIRVTLEGQPKSQLVWLLRNQTTATIEKPAGSKYVKINSNQVGFYRVNYPQTMWDNFSSILALDASDKTMSELDRSNLLDDVFNLADAGLATFPTALNLVKYLKKETGYLPWATGATVLKKLTSRLSASVYYPSVKAFVQSIVGVWYGVGEGKYDWSVNTTDGHLRRMTRVKLLDLACHAGHADCIADAGVKFQAWIKDATTAIPPDVRPLVYRYGMRAVRDEASWQTVWSRYLNEANVQEKTNLLETAAQVQEPQLLRGLLELARDENLVRSQDFFSLLQYIADNPVGGPIVWDWYRENWEYLVERFTLYHRYLGRSILSVTGRFTTQVKLDEMNAFFTKYPEAGAGEASRKTALEAVQYNIKWLQKNEQVVGGSVSATAAE